MNDYYSLLGVRREASPSEITLAFRRLLKEKYQEEGDHFLYSDILQAYRTIANPAKRREYDHQLKKVVGKYEVTDPQNHSPADKKYISGLNALEQKNFPSAVEYFTQAVKLAPENCHYYSQLGVALGMFPGRLSEAERYCKKAIELDPDNPDICYNLGFLYQRHNLVDAAQQAFMQAQRAEQRVWEKFVNRQVLPIELSWIPAPEEGQAPAEVPQEEPAPEPPALKPEPDGQETVMAEPGGTPEPAVALPEEKPNPEPGPDSAVEPEVVSAGLAEGLPPELEQAGPPMETAGIGGRNRSEEEDAGPRSSDQPAIKEEEALDDGGQVILAELISGDEGPQTETARDVQPEQEMAILTNAAEEDFKTTSRPDQGGDLLDELDSLEAVLNGSGPTSGIGSGDGELLLEMKQHHDIVRLPKPAAEAGALAVPADSEEETSLDDLEDEALSLLRELGVAPDQESTEREEPSPEVHSQEAEGSEAESPDSDSDSQEETDPEELARLEEMERKMAEELERLRQEREKLRKKKKK